MLCQLKDQIRLKREIPCYFSYRFIASYVYLIVKMFLFSHTEDVRLVSFQEVLFVSVLNINVVSNLGSDTAKTVESLGRFLFYNLIICVHYFNRYLYFHTHKKCGLFIFK